MHRVIVMSALAACAPARGESPYAKHIEGLRGMLHDKRMKLSIRIEEPFVVLGNAGPDALEREAGTVRWAADHLEKDFFDKRPTRILDVYLFKDADSYEKGVKRLTGSAPGTPYGFYSSATNGLYMNIATGGGTLVHEIVHPYVEANFPNAPAWLNEGLGSLFEQSAERDGHIVGLTNWRLAGLQRTIEAGSLQSFKTLTHLGDNEFYGDDSGTNYAQARYLLYYLQQRGLLRDFYKAFLAAREKDPSGYQTLVKTLGEKDMDAFQKRWEAWVGKLEFR